MKKGNRANERQSVAQEQPQPNSRDEDEISTLKVRRIGNPAEAREAAFRRRKFIYEALMTRQQISFDHIKRHFGRVSKSAISEDIAFFKRLGIKFALRDDGDESIIINEVIRYTEGGDVFRTMRVAEKKIVAKVAAGLIMGSPEKDRVRLGNPLDGCPSGDEIRRLLTKQNEILARRLTEYWRDNSRLIGLDASSTNEQIAGLLSQISLPARDSQLSYLSICSNSRNIFNRVGDPTVPIRAIITGGQQNARTTTLTGVMTEFFLKHAGLLRFGISCVGTTGIDIATGTCLTDSQDEMLVKQLFLEKATTRVIVADNGKIVKPLQRGGFSFTALTAKQVDLVITNCPLSEESFVLINERAKRRVSLEEISDQRTLIKDFISLIVELKSMGVAVLVGWNDLTFDAQELKGIERVRVAFSRAELSTLNLPY